jgi:hypothetical protein
MPARPRLSAEGLAALSVLLLGCGSPTEFSDTRIEAFIVAYASPRARAQALLAATP